MKSLHVLQDPEMNQSFVVVFNQRLIGYIVPTESFFIVMPMSAWNSVGMVRYGPDRAFDARKERAESFIEGIKALLNLDDLLDDFSKQRNVKRTKSLVETAMEKAECQTRQ